MQQSEIDMLSEIYNNYLKTKNRSCRYEFENRTDKRQFCNSAEYLNECGYITIDALSAGFCQIKLTVEGIKFIENGYQDTSNAPVVQGNNSIYVQGSSNQISDNYNNITIDINNSNLPDEYKELLESFIYEIKNPKLSPEKKNEKVKQFLSDFTSGTLSGAASSGLTVLITSLLNSIR